MRKQLISDAVKTHGMIDTKIYQCWCSMKGRCDNEKNPAYKHYGGRGIKYDEKWKEFEGFLEDMQETFEEGLTLERVDVNKGYQKDNCVWIPKTEQQKNRRKQSNNTSGKTGVFIRTHPTGNVSYYARWSENGVSKSKHFSHTRYEDPFQAACDFRESIIKELGYGTEHGK